MHVAIVLGGPTWYRFFGAGENMASMAEREMLQPTIITLSLAAVLAIWGVYAWSGAGVLPKLPLLKIVLCLITLVYLARGALGLFMPLVSNNSQVAQNSTIFWITSSVICLLFGLFHLKGIMNKWPFV